MTAQLASDDQGALESTRDAPPTHCTFTIQSFSLLSSKTNPIEVYETNPFEAGGYKWKLRVCPNGNKNRNIREHISLYLVMTDTDSLPRGWNVTVVFKLLLFDQIRDQYLVVEDSNVTGRRFYRNKIEWGFDKFVTLKTFNDPSNGYLSDDTCAFGAEVFVCKESCRGKDEQLSMIKGGIATKYAWKIDSFSKIDKEWVESETFTAGDHTWKIQLYPKGFDEGKGSHLGLCLVLADTESLPNGRQVFAEVNLKLLNQGDGRCIQSKVSRWLNASSYRRRWPKFAQLSYLMQQGFLFRDTCNVEAEITVLGVAN